MKERLFRFKHFSASHRLSAMKIGVDGVLAGAWARIDGTHSVLDVGCGCGLIALMCAQRCREAKILAIDIHEPSVAEAAHNFSASPWSDRLTARCIDFDGFVRECVATGRKFGHIVSNPPYFDAGVQPDSPRLTARHTGTLSPEVLVANAPLLLEAGGLLTIITPAGSAPAQTEGMILTRACRVRGHADAPVKRILSEYMRPASKSHEPAPVITEIVLESAPGVPTPGYRELCRDFYLKF